MKIQVLLILTLVGAILSPPMQSDTPPETPEESTSLIVFASTRGEDPDALGLYILDTETLEITPLETGFASNVLPRWSPDASQVLFAVPGDWNLYTINADGTELTQVTDFRSNNADWSPDGSQIVFQSDHQNEPQDTPDIYMMDITGENLVELVDLPEQFDFSPRWSPDGSYIIFISSRSGNFEVWRMNANGTDPIQITASDTPVINAAWSPDGEHIVYTQITGDSSADLFTIDKDGSVDSVFQITADDYFDTSPVWSPDGEQVVFSSDRSGNSDLWMIDADGTDLVQLTDDEFYDDAPDWGPDIAHLTQTETSTSTLSADEIAPSHISIEAANGGTIEGTLYGNSPQLVILSNMETNVASEWDVIAPELAARGYMVLTYEYIRGGNTRTLDLRDVLAFMRGQGAEEIVLIGASRGGVVTVQLAADPEGKAEVVAIAVISAPISYQGTTFYTAEEMSSITVPKLVINTEGDTYSEHTQEMYELFVEPKELHIYPGEAHGTQIFKLYGDDLVQRLVDFVEASFAE